MSLRHSLRTEGLQPHPFLVREFGHISLEPEKNLSVPCLARDCLIHIACLTVKEDPVLTISHSGTTAEPHKGCIWKPPHCHPTAAWGSRRGWHHGCGKGFSHPRWFVPLPNCPPTVSWAPAGTVQQHSPSLLGCSVSGCLISGHVKVKWDREVKTAP